MWDLGGLVDVDCLFRMFNKEISDNDEMMSGCSRFDTK